MKLLGEKVMLESNTSYLENILIFKQQMQAMTEAEHNRPNPKFFGNRPSASAAEVFW